NPVLEALTAARNRRPNGFGGSSSGRTTDSDSVNLGSNPSPPANSEGAPFGAPSFFRVVKEVCGGKALPWQGDEDVGAPCSSPSFRARLPASSPASESGAINRLGALVRAHDEQVGGPSCEQANGDHSWNLVDRAFQGERIHDLEIVDIHYLIAIVRHDSFSIDRSSTEAHELARYIGASHRYHFDGQRKTPKHWHE